jgi:hypothetical protein
MRSSGLSASLDIIAARRIIGHLAEQKRPQHTFNAGADGGLLGDLGAPQDLISLDEPREILCSLLRRKPSEKLMCGSSATPRTTGLIDAA